MAQILVGLITYLLLAIYCHEEYNDKDNITRVRQLRIKMRNKLAEMLAKINDDNLQNLPDNLPNAGPPSHASP